MAILNNNIERLALLRDRGALSDEEFEEQRHRIIDNALRTAARSLLWIGLVVWVVLVMVTLVLLVRTPMPF